MIPNETKGTFKYYIINRLGGWVKKMAIFLGSPKTCLRNIWMVPKGAWQLILNQYGIRCPLFLKEITSRELLFEAPYIVMALDWEKYHLDGKVWSLSTNFYPTHEILSQFIPLLWAEIPFYFIDKKEGQNTKSN